MATQHSKRPADTDALDREIELSRRRAVTEQIRIYFTRSENRRIARRNEIHAEALACNIEFDRGSL